MEIEHKIAVLTSLVDALTEAYNVVKLCRLNENYTPILHNIRVYYNNIMIQHRMVVNLMEKSKEIIEKMQKLEQESKDLESDIEGVNKFCENIFDSQENSDSEDVEPISPIKQPKRTALTPVNMNLNLEPLSSGGVGFYSRSAENFSPTPRKPMSSITPKALFLEIREMTAAEYNMLPKYMLSRIRLTTINDFIKVINKTAIMKYAPHNKKKQATRGEDIDLLDELKGERFITNKNIEQALGKPLDKQSFGIFPILRHTQRIAERRIGKHNVIVFL